MKRDDAMAVIDLVKGAIRAHHEGSLNLAEVEQAFIDRTTERKPAPPPAPKHTVTLPCGHDNEFTIDQLRSSEVEPSALLICTKCFESAICTSVNRVQRANAAPKYTYVFHKVRFL